MQFDLKKIKTESVVPLAIVSGLAAGNLAFKAASSKLNPLISSLILAAAGLLIAVNVKADFVKNSALAISAFGGLKLLNTMSADPMSGMDGFGDLGISLPEGVRSAIRKVFPSLNGDEDMQVIGAYDEFGAVDTDYQVLGPDNEFGAVEYDMGATDDLVLPRLNGSDIDVAGLDGRRATGRFPAFKAKANPSAAAAPRTRMLPAAKAASPTSNAAAVMRNRAAMPGGKNPMHLTCQVAGLGEVSVDIA